MNSGSIPGLLTPLPFTHFDGLCFRAHHPHWANDPKSGEGAARRGGRFNPRGTPALYTALTPTNTWMEAQQGLPFKAQPMTLVAYRVVCAAIVDLSAPEILVALAITVAELSGPWEDLATRGQDPPTWTLARRLIAAGARGCLAPSYAPGTGPAERCLILWAWNGDGGCRLELIDDFGRLPQDSRSWVDQP